MHSILTDEIRIIWVPLQLGPRRGGVLGEELHICKIYRDVPPKWVDFTPKICKHGSHLYPPKKGKKKISKAWVKFVENWVKDHDKNFGKWVYSLSKS